MRHGASSVVAALLSLASGVGLPPALAEGAAGAISWGESYAAALERAEADGKPVLVDVWAVWCVPCKEMDETTYRDPLVVREAAGFVPLKVDADVATSFVERYRVDAYPTLLFLDGRGREISRWRGAIAAEPLARWMRPVGAGYPAYRLAVGREDDPAAAIVVADYLTGAGNPAGAADRLRRSLDALGDSDPAARDSLELRVGEAQVAAGEPKAACKTFERLAERAGGPETRGRALAGLVRAERLRGREARAEAALARLREEFPGLAEASGL